MKIVIIGWSQFPSGDASAARIRTFAKGFIENGGSVHFITTAKIESAAKDVSQVMHWEGISYESSYSLKKIKGFFSRFNIVKHVQSLRKSWRMVQQRIDQDECDIIYFYGWSLLANYPIRKKAIRNRIPFFFDICEWYPPQHFGKWLINPLYYDDWLGRQLPGKKCSGIIAITHYIEEKYTKQGIPVILVPAIYDFSQMVVKPIYDNTNNARRSSFTVLYAGFCKPGDGLDLLIGAVKIVKLKGIPVQLYIIGTDGTSGVALEYKKRCQDDDTLQDIVHFKGKIPQTEYPAMLASVDVLTLARRETMTNLAAFPTRLPEYLVTAQPVLTTSVPDVPKYLTPDLHAKIVMPDSIEAIAEGLTDLWDNPAKAKAIGLAGQARGAAIFDYRPYTTSLYEMFVTARKKK